jgi:hypothetical protein
MKAERREIANVYEGFRQLVLRSTTHIPASNRKTNSTPVAPTEANVT